MLPPRWVVSALVLAGMPACAGPMTQAREKNTQLATTVAELRAELRAERRKRRDLENQVFLLQDRLETAALRRPDDAPPPQLPVEILSPDDVPENGQLVGTTDDGTAIIYVDEATAPPIVIDEDDLTGGDAVPPPPRPRTRTRTARTARGPVRPPRDGRTAISETGGRAPLRDLPTSSELGTAPAPPLPTAARTASAADADDEGGDPALALYRRGTAALKAREHAGAIAAFREIVARFPQHDYADNAQYWLGEAYYDQKDYARAITEFRATVARYPRGNKVPDALLKIGFAYQALGESDKARAALQQVVSLYPGSSPAAIATARLEKP